MLCAFSFLTQASLVAWSRNKQKAPLVAMTTSLFRTVWHVMLRSQFVYQSCQRRRLPCERMRPRMRWWYHDVALQLRVRCMGRLPLAQQTNLTIPVTKGLMFLLVICICVFMSLCVYGCVCVCVCVCVCLLVCCDVSISVCVCSCIGGNS